MKDYLKDLFPLGDVVWAQKLVSSENADKVLLALKNGINAVVDPLGVTPELCSAVKGQDINGFPFVVSDYESCADDKLIVYPLAETYARLAVDEPVVTGTIVLVSSRGLLIKGEDGKEYVFYAPFEQHYVQQMQPGDKMAFSLITHPEKGPIVRNIVEGTVAGKRIRFTDYAKCRSWLSSGLPVSRGAFVLNSVVELQKYTTSCFYHAASRSYIDKTRVLCPENLARDYEFYLARVEAIYANEIDFQLLVGWNE